MATEDDVRELALALPATTERPSYGTPGFRVKDRLFARIREPDVLVLFVGGLDEKEFLIGAEPGKFFTVPHYDGHPSVLVPAQRRRSGGARGAARGLLVRPCPEGADRRARAKGLDRHPHRASWPSMAGVRALGYRVGGG